MTKRPTKTERRKKEREKKNRFVTLFLNGHKVTIDSERNPLLKVFRTGHISQPELATAQEIAADFDKATYAGLKTASFEPAVDNSSAPEARLNLEALDAQKRLHRLRDMIGAECFELVHAVIVDGFSLNAIQGAGGHNRNELARMFKTAMARASVLYDFRPSEDSESRTSRAVERLREQREKDRPNRDHPFR